MPARNSPVQCLQQKSHCMLSMGQRHVQQTCEMHVDHGHGVKNLAGDNVHAKQGQDCFNMVLGTQVQTHQNLLTSPCLLVCIAEHRLHAQEEHKMSTNALSTMSTLIKHTKHTLRTGHTEHAQTAQALLSTEHAPSTQTNHHQAHTEHNKHQAPITMSTEHTEHTKHTKQSKYIEHAKHTEHTEHTAQAH